MIIGQFLAASENPYHSPWFPAGGNEMTSVLDLINAVGGATIEVTVETKNSEQDDQAATPLGGSGPLGVAGRHPFVVGANINQGPSGGPGFFELARYRYDVVGPAGSGVHFRMQNPSWLSH